jgi:hypothetical protein
VLAAAVIYFLQEVEAEPVGACRRLVEPFSRWNCPPADHRMQARNVAMRNPG